MIDESGNTSIKVQDCVHGFRVSDQRAGSNEEHPSVSVDLPGGHFTIHARGTAYTLPLSLMGDLHDQLGYALPEVSARLNRAKV